MSRQKKHWTDRRMNKHNEKTEREIRKRRKKQLFTRKTTLSFPHSVPTHLQLLRLNFYTNRHHYHWITSKYTVLCSSTLCKCSKCKFLQSMSLQFILFVCNSLPILNLGSYRYLVTYYKLEFIRILTVDLQSSFLPFWMIFVCVLNFSSAFVCSSSFENHINFICFATCKYTRQNMSLTIPSKSNLLLNFFVNASTGWFFILNLMKRKDALFSPVFLLPINWINFRTVVLIENEIIQLHWFPMGIHASYTVNSELWNFSPTLFPHAVKKLLCFQYFVD